MYLPTMCKVAVLVHTQSVSEKRNFWDKNIGCKQPGGYN